MSDNKTKAEEDKFESYVDEEPIAPVSINKYNPYELKGNLDDTIINLLEEKKFVEDNTNMNLKIVLGLLCIAISAVSQFYKKNKHKWASNLPLTRITLLESFPGKVKLVSFCLDFSPSKFLITK